MDPNDAELLTTLKARYEASRRKISLLRAAVVAVVVFFVLFAEQRAGLLREQVAVAAALVMVSLTYFSSVQGGDGFRGVRAGLFAGALPLTAALASEQMGAVCTPIGCSSVCAAACAASGAAAALWVARGLRRHEAAPKSWLFAGSSLIATGALGCACVSYTGVIALTIAVAASLGTASVLRRA